MSLVQDSILIAILKKYINLPLQTESKGETSYGFESYQVVPCCPLGKSWLGKWYKVLGSEKGKMMVRSLIQVKKQKR
jgi:hypothetical protein